MLGEVKKEITETIKDELLTAMDAYKTIAQQLIDKLITETNQPRKELILKGHYDEIENADLLNGANTLSENWHFDVHGEHCMFQNAITHQTLEVYLSGEENIGVLDPYFFYQFLETTENLRHLTQYFDNSFSDVLHFFEVLEQQKLLTQMYKCNYKKV